jgi:hypothetical protein
MAVATKIIRTRERSKVSFPYNPLNDGIEVAQAIFQKGGQQGTIDQVAAWTGHGTTNSGAFKLKLYAGRLFGLITIHRDKIALTELGGEILDPQKERQARASAFLSVPLYREIYEKYKGKIVPSEAGLESEMVSIGVAPKQKDRARRIFLQSAQQAGLFESGRERLILPAGTMQHHKPKAPLEQHDSGKGGYAPPPPPLFPAPDGELHPFIRGLLQTLPPQGAAWPAQRREQWLKTAANIFNLIYGDDEGGQKSE